MTREQALYALRDAKANASRTVELAKMMQRENHHHAQAIESIGLSLQAIARALEEMNK